MSAKELFASLFGSNKNQPAVADLQKQIAQLKVRLSNVLNVQQRALRRLFRLPKVLARVLQVELSPQGELIDDSTVKFVFMGSDAPWLELLVQPYKSSITLVDVSGKQEPLTFNLADDGTGDLKGSMLREMVGYGEFARRNAGDTPGALILDLNKQLALPGDSVRNAA